MEKDWVNAFKYTESLLSNDEDTQVDVDVDVAFPGQSVVEIMNCRIMGNEPTTSSYGQHLSSNFQKRFGPLTGLIFNTWRWFDGAQ